MTKEQENDSTGSDSTLVWEVVKAHYKQAGVDIEGMITSTCKDLMYELHLENTSLSVEERNKLLNTVIYKSMVVRAARHWAECSECQLQVTNSYIPDITMK